MDLQRKLDEARSHGAGRAVINQINEYYAAERSRIIDQLKDQEEQMAASISRTKLDDIRLQYDKQMEAIEKLERERVFAAMDSEEEIQEIRKRFAEMREQSESQFEIDINQAKLDEARDAIKGWQEQLSDSLLTTIMDLEMFGDEAAVIISDIGLQLMELSFSSTLSRFQEFGRAMGEGAKFSESLTQALAELSKQILQQLPMMFLQAGLQLIANGQWPLGLGFIAAAGSSAIIAGYVEGKTSHANGGVFDEYGRAARQFASGGTFTNQIVTAPTLFRYGSGFLGEMGEAGPEAVMPLTRMPDGNLGVETRGAGAANVIVNIINNTNTEVRQEESSDEDGNKQIDVYIGEMINQHITSGKADRAMAGRYSVRPAGV
jgi:hypothetical protein